MYWDQQTSPQIELLDKDTPVILPVAAIEQHGAHLPLATDRMIGEHFCGRLHQELPGKIIILPTISIGCSEHHKDFAGSLSVQHWHLFNQLSDIAECVVKYGFKNIILFNSHGGNQAIGQTFLESFGYRNPDITLVFITWWKTALEKLKKLNETGPGGSGHAGEFETSLMLLIAPHLVQLDLRKPKSNVPTYDWAEGDMIYGSKASLYRTMKEMTGHGVYGDPSQVSKDKGQEISDIVTKELKKIILDLINP